MARDESKIWSRVYGSAWVFVIFHIINCIGFAFYFMYNLHLVNRDLTSFDLFFRNEESRRYTRILQLSFQAKMFLCFGDISLFKVLLTIDISNVPLTGLEFSHESDVRNFDNFNMY